MLSARYECSHSMIFLPSRVFESAQSSFCAAASKPSQTLSHFHIMAVKQKGKDTERFIDSTKVTYAVSGAVICGILGYCYYSYLQKHTKSGPHRSLSIKSSAITPSDSVVSSSDISESISSPKVCHSQYPLSII